MAEWQALGPPQGTQARGRGRNVPRASQSRPAIPAGRPVGRLTAQPHWLLHAPSPRTGQTTNRWDGRRGPSSSGSARCSWSATTRRRRLSASSRCPRPPGLHSGTVLISIFRSAAVKGKALLKQHDAAVGSQETRTKGSGVGRPGGGAEGGAARQHLQTSSWPPPRPEPQQCRPFRFCK